jgi:two-component system, LytTR family, sensor kinase
MAMSEPLHSEPSTKWFWIAGIWLAGGLFDASQTVLIMRAEGRQGTWLPLFAIELVLWLPWVLATPLIIRLVRRFPLFRGPTVRSVAVHLVTFITVSAVTETWAAVLLVLFNPWHNKRPPTFMDTWSVSLLYQILTFVDRKSVV